MTEFIDHWQTLIAGGLALIAALGTILATVRSARIQVEAITRQNELLKATEQRKEARDKKALADTILPRISEIKRRSELNLHKEGSLVAKPLPGSIVQKTLKDVVGDLIVFDLFRDRIGTLGLATSEAFFVLEIECDLLKNGIGSGRQMPYSEFDPRVRKLIISSGKLIDILEAEISKTKQILGEE